MCVLPNEAMTRVFAASPTLVSIGSRRVYVYTKGVIFHTGQTKCGRLIAKVTGHHPRASGSWSISDGRQQESDGRSSVVRQVQDLPTHISDLNKQGVHFRNEMEVGPSGRQIRLGKDE